jgi:hypothetical protein
MEAAAAKSSLKVLVGKLPNKKLLTWQPPTGATW